MIIEATDWYVIVEIPDCTREFALERGIKMRWRIFYWRIAVWEKTEHGVVGHIADGDNLETVADRVDHLHSGDRPTIRYKHASHFYR